MEWVKLNEINYQKQTNKQTNENYKPPLDKEKPIITKYRIPKLITEVRVGVQIIISFYKHLHKCNT